MQQELRSYSSKLVGSCSSRHYIVFGVWPSSASRIVVGGGKGRLASNRDCTEIVKGIGP